MVPKPRKMVMRLVVVLTVGFFRAWVNLAPRYLLDSQRRAR